MVLDAAVEQVLTDGMGAGLERVRLEDAVRTADVSRTAAYRCWPQRDDFVIDLLTALVEQALPVRSTRSVEAAEQLLRVVEADPDMLRTVGGRRRLLRTAVVGTADEDLRADREDGRRWRLYLTLALTVSALPDGPGRERVAAAVADAESRVLDRLETSYRLLLDLFGFTARVSHRELAEIGLSLLRGFVIGASTGVVAGSPGAAYGLMLDAAVEPADSSEWDRRRRDELMDVLRGGEIFDRTE